MKETKRKAFNFLRSYFDVLNELKEDADKLDFLMAIINKQFLNEDPKDLGFIGKLCYESQRHQIEKSVSGWITANKTDLKGGAILPKGSPPTPPPTLPKGSPSVLPKGEVQEEGEEQEEEQEQVKDKSKELATAKAVAPTLEERKNNFDLEVLRLAEEMQMLPDTAKAFSDYWTEHNAGGKKMLFEMKKVFDVKRRMATWQKNEQKFKGNQMTGAESVGTVTDFMNGI